MRQNDNGHWHSLSTAADCCRCRRLPRLLCSCCWSRSSLAIAPRLTELASLQARLTVGPSWGTTPKGLFCAVTVAVAATNSCAATNRVFATNANVGKTLPFPCVSTALAAKKVSFLRSSGSDTVFNVCFH